MAGRRRRHLFTDQQLIELHEQAFNDTEIAGELGVPRITVFRRRRKIGLKVQDRKRLFTDQQLIELHEQGFNDTEKAEKLGANKNIVGKHRRRLGLKAIRKHGAESYIRRRRFTDEQLIELHEQGFNDREIGEKLGAGTNAVNFHRRKLGLRPIRSHGIKAQDRTR